MSGLRLINTPPETFRFPEWRDDIFYAKDSVVRYASYMAPAPGDSDSDNLLTRFYIAIKDVPPTTGIPPRRQDRWAAIASTAFAVGQIVEQIIENDSDIEWLRQNQRKIILEKDSDFSVKRAEHDSDLLMTYRDFKAADSDLTERFDSDILSVKARLLVLEDENDSDNLVLKTEHDSDTAMTYHDFRSADSEINAKLTQPSWDYGSYF